MSKQLSSMVWDYVVFVLFIIISTIYPLWGDMRGKKGKQTKANYAFASGKVSMFAMMLSIARGTLGVRAFIGYPSELFYRGSGMWETLYGLLNAYPLVCFVFVPVYCSLGITSVYQYLDLRFNSRLVRRLASASFILRNIFTLGITVYTPCVALNTVVGIPYWASLIAMTVISIIFTLLGGLKAAITADVIQGLTMIFVSIGVIIQGAYETGGVAKVYNINNDNDRLQFFRFSGDLTTRVDTLSAYTGQLFISLSVLGCQQNLVQRYLSMKSEKDVRTTLMANMPFITILFSLSWVVGMVIYSTYSMCDPMEAGYIKKMDEILPFFVEDKLSYIPGCLGIFMAALFNGALCLNVSNLNSLAIVTWEDFVSHLPRFKEMVDKNQLAMIKFIGVTYAFIIMGVAFSVGLLSGVIEGAMLTSSATTGPLVGVFLLAMLVPIANWKGASAGMITSHILTIFITAGSFTVQKPPSELLPTSTEGCTNTTFSPWITKSDTSWLIQTSPVEIGWNSDDENAFLLPHQNVPFVPSERTNLEALFSISYMYYSVIGTIVTVIIGTLVSWATSSSSDEFDEKLLHPIVIKIRKYMSKDKLCNKNTETSTTTTSNAQINLGFDNDLPIDKTTIAVIQTTSQSSSNVSSTVTSDNSDGIFKFEEIELTMPKCRDRCNNQLKLQIEPIEKYRKLSVT